MPIQKFTSSVTMSVAPLAATVAGTAGASAYTLARLLGTGSTLSLISGTNSNLTLSGLNIVPTAAIGLTTQTAEVREVLGQLAIEYPVAITGNVAVSTGPLTTMPLPDSGAILLDIDPNTLTGLADGARVTSYTDPTSGIVVTAPVNGPVLNKSMKNGKAGFQFANKDDRLVIPSKATTSLAPLYSNVFPDTADNTTKPAGTGWSAIIIVHNPLGTSQYSPVISTDFNNMYVSANASNIGYTANAQTDGLTVAQFTGAGVVSNDFHVIVLSGEGNTGQTGRRYVNGQFAGGSFALNSAYDVILGAMFNSQNSGFNSTFQGGILRAVFFRGALSPAKALQAYFWACATYGKALPITGRSNFFVFDGDSITAGTGSSGFLGYSNSGQIARTRNWAPGVWGNVGKPSQQVYNANSPGNDNIGASVRDIDEYRTVLGSAMNIHVIFGEWYNYQTNQAGAQRTYATNVKSRGKVNKIFGWTSTSSKADGATRTAFNAEFMANKGVYDDVWPIHTDPNIGVDGTLGTTTPNTVTGDNIHPNDAGYSFFASYIGARMTEAGYAS